MEDAALIVGDIRDVHVVAVYRAMKHSGAPEPLILDAPSLRKHGFTLADDDLRHRGRTIATHRGRGWLRRVAPPQWGGQHAGSSLAKTEVNSFVALLAGIARSSGRRWLTPLSGLGRAEDKLFQLSVAREIGVRAPRTLVTSDSEEAADVLGDPFLVKPLVTGYFREESGSPRAVFATEISRDDARAADFGAAPFLAQSVIRARTHLRAVTVGNQVWIGELPAVDYPLDWRAAADAHVSWKPGSNQEVEKLALRMSEAANVGYSSQDWIVDNDGPVFLDLNPAGQWLFLPEAVSAPVTTAIASFLLGRDG